MTVHIAVVLYYLVLLAGLLWVSVKDIRTHTIPNSYVLVLMLYGELSFYFNTLRLHPCYGASQLLELLFSSVLGSLAGAGILLLVTVISKERGFGGGDIKLMAVLGFIYGFWSSLSILLIAMASGSMAGLVVRKYKRGDMVQLPLAPFLFLGCAIVTYFIL